MHLTEGEEQAVAAWAHLNRRVAAASPNEPGH